jgi:hypothetical protein
MKMDICLCIILHNNILIVINELNFFIFYICANEMGVGRGGGGREREGKWEEEISERKNGQIFV